MAISFSSPTRREMMILICSVLVFILILQVDFSTYSPDGSRRVLGLKVHEPWKPSDLGVNPGVLPERMRGQGDWDETSLETIRNAEQLLLNHLLLGKDGQYDEKSLDAIVQAYEDSKNSDLHESWSGSSTTIHADTSAAILSKLGLARDARMDNMLTTWHGTDELPRTEVVAHAPGWTIFRNLYLLNRTWYIVTDNPSDFPLIRMMISTGVELWNDEESIKNREPTDKDMKIVFPSEAKRILGTQASRVAGTSLLCNDPPQFLNHYYHFAAELLFGMWRTYATLDQNIESDGITELPTPRRFIFTHANAMEWRDYSKMNTFLMKSVFPSMSYEFQDEFVDREDAARPYLYDRVIFADRAAAVRGPQFAQTWRTASEAFTLNGSPYWWAPVRKNLLEFVGVPESTLHPADASKPVITYVSRQDWGRRMLKKEDHEKLVQELNRLRDEYHYEVNIVSMDKLSRDEQIRLAARTTIMLGVHGNGLTHLLWMKPTPRATVIEFFFPDGFAHDYEFTSRALGIAHYGFWNDRYFTAPDTPEVAYPEGFQGNEIPIDGKVVADLIHARLTIPVETGQVADIEALEEQELEDEAAILDDENDPAEFIGVEA